MNNNWKDLMNADWQFFIDNKYGHINSPLLRAIKGNQDVVNATSNEPNGGADGWINPSLNSIERFIVPITRLQAETYWPNLVKSLEGM